MGDNKRCGYGMYTQQDCEYGCVFHDLFPPDDPGSHVRYTVVAEMFREDYLRKLFTVYAKTADDRQQALRNIIGDATRRTENPVKGSEGLVRQLQGFSDTVVDRPSKKRKIEEKPVSCALPQDQAAFAELDKLREENFVLRQRLEGSERMLISNLLRGLQYERDKVVSPENQGFERTTLLSRLKNRLVARRKKYRSTDCQEIGYAKARGA